MSRSKLHLRYILLALVAVLAIGMAKQPKQKKETEEKATVPIQKEPVKELAKQVAPILPEITPHTVIEPKENGEIDWGTGMLTATGKAVIDKEIKNPAQARLMAERAATVVAQRNLLELIKEVRVTSETVVENMMLESDVIISRVDGVVKGAKPIGKPKYDEDVVEVTLQVPLYAQNGIGDAITGASAISSLPEELGMTQELQEFINQYSSIVFDTRGTNFKPSLFPKIYDKSGNLVFDPQRYYDPNNPYMQRAVYYLKKLEELANLPGVKDNPYVIKALETLHGDIVISNEDAQKIGWLSSAYKKLVSAGKFIFTLL